MKNLSVNLIQKIQTNRYLPLISLIIYCSVAIFVSGLRLKSTPSGLISWDKFLHMLEYFGMGLVGARTFYTYFELRRKKLFLYNLIFVSLFSVIDEIRQGFVGYFDTGIFSGVRDASIWDWCADTLGATLATIFFMKIVLLVKDSLDKLETRDN